MLRTRSERESSSSWAGRGRERHGRRGGRGRSPEPSSSTASSSALPRSDTSAGLSVVPVAPGARPRSSVSCTMTPAVTEGLGLGLDLVGHVEGLPPSGAPPESCAEAVCTPTMATLRSTTAAPPARARRAFSSLPGAGSDSSADRRVDFVLIPTHPPGRCSRTARGRACAGSGYRHARISAQEIPREPERGLGGSEVPPDSRPSGGRAFGHRERQIVAGSPPFAHSRSRRPSGPVSRTSSRSAPAARRSASPEASGRCRRSPPARRRAARRDQVGRAAAGDVGQRRERLSASGSGPGRTTGRTRSCRRPARRATRCRPRGRRRGRRGRGCRRTQLGQVFRPRPEVQIGSAVRRGSRRATRPGSRPRPALVACRPAARPVAERAGRPPHPRALERGQAGGGRFDLGFGHFQLAAVGQVLLCPIDQLAGGLGRQQQRARRQPLEQQVADAVPDLGRRRAIARRALDPPVVDRGDLPGVDDAGDRDDLEQELPVLEHGQRLVEADPQHLQRAAGDGEGMDRGLVHHQVVDEVEGRHVGAAEARADLVAGIGVERRADVLLEADRADHPARGWPARPDGRPPPSRP